MGIECAVFGNDPNWGRVLAAVIGGWPAARGQSGDRQHDENLTGGFQQRGPLVSCPREGCPRMLVRGVAERPVEGGAGPLPAALAGRQRACAS